MKLLFSRNIINYFKLNNKVSKNYVIYKLIKVFYSLKNKINRQSYLLSSNNFIKLYFFKIKYRSVICNIVNDKWFFLKINNKWI
jgi:hypothetical protein